MDLIKRAVLALAVAGFALAAYLPSAQAADWRGSGWKEPSAVSYHFYYGSAHVEYWVGWGIDWTVSYNHTAYVPHWAISDCTGSGGLVYAETWSGGGGNEYNWTPACPGATIVDQGGTYMFQ